MKDKIVKWLIGDQYKIVPREEVKVRSVKSRKELIEECIENLDFARIQDVMEALDWKWFNLNRIPTLKELKEAAEERLFLACAVAFDPDVNPTGKNPGPYHSDSGGFRAEVLLNETGSFIDYVKISFVVADWDANARD